MHASGIADGMIAVPDLEHFDASSGSLLERLIFNHRPWVLLACALLTALFASQLRGLEISANFENTLPQSHPYIRNYLDNKGQLRGLGDSVRIVVENPNGDIFDRGYLGVLKMINDELFLLPGVDRAWMKSIWAPVVRWTEVTEEGFMGGPVMPQTYDGGAESIEALRLNVTRAGVIGSLVANDLRSSAIVVPLLTKDAKGQPLDYHQLASSLEAIRQKHEPRAGTTAAETAMGAAPPVRVHIVGFAKLVGDLIDGVRKVMGFFAAAAVIAAGFFSSTRAAGAVRRWCWRARSLPWYGSSAWSPGSAML